MRVKLVKKKLSALRSPEKNIRLHPDKQIKEYVRSIKKNGQLKPLVVDEDGVIWIGNGLHEAMIQCGHEEAFCLVKTGMTEADKKKMMLADNRIFDLGIDDMSAFDAFILELKDDLDIPGFDEDMLKSLVMEPQEVNGLISEYGLVNEDRADEMRKSNGLNSGQDVGYGADGGEGESSEESVDIRKLIICPKCGEQIWQ